MVYVFRLGLTTPRGYQLSWGQPLHCYDVCGSSSSSFSVKDSL